MKREYKECSVRGKVSCSANLEQQLVIRKRIRDVSATVCAGWQLCAAAYEAAEGGVFLDLILRNCKIRGEEGYKDIGISDGLIARVADKLSETASVEIDAGGSLTVPGFVNPHMHLDKCLLGEVMRPNVSQTLQEAIEITWDFKRRYTNEDIKQRSMKVVKLAVTAGTAVMRAFADVDSYAELKAVEGLLKVKEDCRGLIDLQVVAFPQEGIIRDPGTAELLDHAMQLGADVVGGLPWYEMTDEDVRKHIDIVFEIAKKYDKDIHMLVDDTDDAYSRSLEYLAVKTMREGFQGRVTASHCGALASYNHYYAAKVISLVRAAGISICSNPHISLVLAGRKDVEPIRRGITRVKELLKAGVNVCSGQDDVCDPYYPFGHADQLEVAFMMAHTAQLTYPSELETVFDMVTTNAAKALRLEGYGIREGCKADIVVINANNVLEALRFRPVRKYVIKAGRIVAESSMSTKIAGDI